MKTITRLFAGLAIAAALTFTSSAQSGPSGIASIQGAQDAVVQQITSRLNGSNTNRCSAVSTASEVRQLAEALVVLQAAEERSYNLLNLRDAAPQTATVAVMTRALAEAKALGVDRTVRNNLQTEWATARNLTAADAAVGKVFQATSARNAEVAERGTFRRLLPEWLGGTSSFANHTVPQKEGEDLIMARIRDIEKRISNQAVIGTIPPAAK